MKKLFIIAIISASAIACNNPEPAKETTAAAPAVTDSVEKIDYAYLPEFHQPDYWDRGDQKKVAMVLKSLKAFENNKLDESISAFADSILYSFDGFYAKISKDSMLSIFKSTWKDMSNLKVSMEDYEAVISKDKKEEFVTLWYKETMTDKKGKVDSVAVVNDLRIENGKITILDEKMRKFPVKK